MATACIGLGSNLGDRLANLGEAVRRILDDGVVSVDRRAAVASVYETAPMDMPPECPPFLNAALRVDVRGSPRDLLSRLLEIESAMGRRRSQRAESRPIDLDLLLFGDVTVSEPDLVVPHSRMHERRFVLEPLAEIAGNLIHPATGLTISALAAQLRHVDEEQWVRRVQGPTWFDLWARSR